MKKLNELQENSERQCNMLRNKMSEQKGYFSKKKIKILNKKKREGAILELENSINKMKNELVSAKNRADNMREN